MAVTPRVLIPATVVANSITPYYVSTGATTLVDSFQVINFSAGPVDISVYVVTVGDTASTTNLRKTKTLQALETYSFPEVVGQTLLPGGFISASASVAASLNIRSSGRLVS